MIFTRDFLQDEINCKVVVFFFFFSCLSSRCNFVLENIFNPFRNK